MKLTLDSNEPLEDAMRVVGALYGVTLVLSNDEQDATKPARKSTGNPTSTKRTAKRKPSAARKARPTAPATDAEPAQPEEARALRPASSPSNADLRTWARRNGFTVSDRGRVPASIVTAYRNAQDH